MTEERRKDKRVKEDFSILCKIFRKIELEGSVSKIIDISKTGIAFQTNTPVAKNDIVQMILRIPPDFQEKIEIFGRIVDSEPITDSEFKIRVSFINIAQPTQENLTRIIEQANFRSALKK
jgi:hypothetical protein